MSRKTILGTLSGVALGAVGASYVLEKERARQQELAEKHLALFVMMCDWMRRKQEGISMGAYLKDQGYKSVAVYGMSYAGERVLDELRDNGIEVAYAIDRKVDAMYADVEICSPEDELAEVDAVIVTAITFFDEIEEKLSAKLDCPILSLDDIIYEM